MTKQTIGGVFFRAKDPAALAQWYDDTFGITAMRVTNPEGNKIELWQPLDYHIYYE